ncbi:endo alpha-1,4 polygalactosaminidase [Microbacterium sp. NPDC091313]
MAESLTTTRRWRRRAGVAVAAVMSATLLAGCGGSPSSADDSAALPPAGAAFDYQLGGAYPPPDGVAVVARDRTAVVDASAYSICYVNAFQTQPGESDAWPEQALLRRDGEPVIDPGWPDEIIVDTSTDESREAVVATVTRWIRQCASDGFDAVEFDNLDTFTRTDGALTLDDNLAVARGLVAVASDAGLAAGQKNAAEYTRQLQEGAGFDFAVAEECAAFEECDAYTDVYGEHVLAIEYDDALPRTFAEMCADPATPRSVVLRDRDLVTPDDPAYVYERC